MHPESRVWALFRLLFPGAITVTLTVPSLVVGALAFDIRDDINISAADIGGLVSGFYVLSLACTRLSLPLLQRFQAISVARVGLALSALGVLVGMALGSKTGLVTMCLVAGVANGLATPSANLMIALTVPDHRRGLAYGLRMSAVPGAAAVTAVGAALVAHSDIGWRACLAALAAVCLLLAVASYAGSASLASPSRDGAVQPEAQGGLGGLRVLALGGLLAASACSTLSPFLVEGLIAGGASPGDAALMLGIGAWVGVATRICVGLAADRFPVPSRHLTSATMMLFTAAAGMIVLGFGRGTTVLALATLLTFSFGWAWPGLILHAAMALNVNHLATASSYIQMGTYSGGLLGPLFFGLLVDAGSFRLAWCCTAALATCAGVTVLVANRVSHARREPRTAPATA